MRRSTNTRPVPLRLRVTPREAWQAGPHAVRAWEVVSMPGLLEAAGRGGRLGVVADVVGVGRQAGRLPGGDAATGDEGGGERAERVGYGEQGGGLARREGGERDDHEEEDV